MKKLGVLLILGIATTILLTGCKPKGDPLTPITAYYQDIKDGNVEGSYDQLAESTKKNFGKADFIKWQNTGSELRTLKEFKLEKSNEYKNKVIEGTKYKNVIEFNVVEIQQDLYAGKEVTGNYKRNVVNDNGVWKVYREKVNVKDSIAENTVNIAYMYSEGKGGKTKDLNQAVTILNEALKYNKDYAPIYYALGSTYSDLTRYDEALVAINTFIPKITDKLQKSDGYNVLGNTYLGKENIAKAKESYKKALELNPNNQYARTNSVQLK